jgi:SNF2 family DNA or RNA helicase
MTSRGPTTKKPLSKPSAPAWSKLAHGYQRRAVKFLLEHGAAALLLDPGMGKTSAVLKALDALIKAKVSRKTLVIAPLRVAQLVWPEEPGEWSVLAHLRVAVLHGKHKEAALHSDADIYVINPEGLPWLLTGQSKGGTVDLRRWKAFGFDTLVIDELTKFKHTSGVRFKMLKKVLGTFSRRWGLTGTPAPNGLIDLFGQMYVLDMGNALGSYVTHYRMKYFINPDGQGWKWVLQPGAGERIYAALRPLAMRASAEDHLELPEIVPLKIFVDLPPKVRDLYDQLEDDMIAKIDSREVVASNAAAASTKCRQIANGAVYIDDDIASRVTGKLRDVLVLHDEKINALKDLVEELSGSPVFIAYEFNHDISRLRVAFPEAKFMCDAKNIATAKKLETEWNNGEISVLFGHPASVGHGLNMQKGSAHHVVWFGMFWDLELYDQFIRRVRRQGNKAARVFVHHIIARDTVDEIVFHVQRSKTKVQSALLEALKGKR